MNLEEALDIIDTDPCYIGLHESSKGVSYEDYFEAKSLVSEAAEKQIQKKPIERPPGKSFGICPDCMHDVYIRKDINNCANCGQALDWGRDNG